MANSGISPEELLRRMNGGAPPAQQQTPQPVAPVPQPAANPNPAPQPTVSPTPVPAPAPVPVTPAPVVTKQEQRTEPESAPRVPATDFGLVNPGEPAVTAGIDETPESDSDMYDDEVTAKLDAAANAARERAAEEASKPANKGHKVAPLKSSKAKEDVPDKKEQVRDLPSSVMAVIRREFPGALSKADAISAYVYVHAAGTELGSNIQLSDAAKEAVRRYSGDNTMSILDSRLSHLEKMLSGVVTRTELCELALAYIVCDRAFGIKAEQISPAKAQFRETNVLDVLDRLRAETAEQHAVDVISNGRPKRRPKPTAVTPAKSESKPKVAPPPANNSDDDDDWL